MEGEPVNPHSSLKIPSSKLPLADALTIILGPGLPGLSFWIFQPSFKHHLRLLCHAGHGPWHRRHRVRSVSGVVLQQGPACAQGTSKAAEQMMGPSDLSEAEGKKVGIFLTFFNTHKCISILNLYISLI